MKAKKPKTRKTPKPRRRQAPLPLRQAEAPPTSKSIMDMIMTSLGGGDPTDLRRRRFVTALMQALPEMKPDDMDKVEPHLVTVIGRTALQRRHDALEGVNRG